MRHAHAIAPLLVLPLAAAAYGCISGSDPVVIPIDPSLPPIVEQAGGKLEIDVATVDFGYVDCGSAPASKTVKVKNTGGKALTYSLRLEGSGFAIVGAASSTLQPGGDTTVTVTAEVDSSATPRVPREGAILVEAPDAPIPSVRIPLKVIPDGAVVTVTPVSAAFGQVNVGEFGVPVPVTIKNTGFAPISVSFQVPTNEFGLAWTNVPEAIAIGPTESRTLSATFAPTSNGKKSFTSSLTFEGPVCGDVPKTLELAGEGVLLPVTVTPSPLNFGSVDCGTAAAAKTVTIKNDNAFPVTYSAVLKTAPSPFTLSSASGTIAAKASAALIVTPKPMTAPRSIAANAYGDELTITTNAPTDLPHVVTIMQSARGAILATSLPSPAFGTQTVGTTTNRTLTVTNTGNQAATVRVATAAPFSVSPAAPAPITIAGGGATGTATVSFTPTTSAAATANVSLAVTGAQCAASPAALPVSGTGAYPIFSAGGRLTSFNVTCGAAVAGQSVVVQNDPSAAGKLLITNIQVTGPFTVSATSLAAIDPGKSASITITPNAPVIGTDRATQSDSGALTFKTNEAGNPTKTFALQRNVHGANIEYAQLLNVGFVPITQVDYDGCPGQTPVNSNFYMRNTGDQDVAVVNMATVAEWTFADVAGQKSFGIITNGAAQVTGSYSGPINASRAAVAVTPAATPVTNVCIPPKPLSMKYNLLSVNDTRCVIIL